MRKSAIARNEWFDKEVPTTRTGIALPPERIALASEITATSESQFFVGLTGDISRGGVFIATYRRVAIGSRVQVTLSLPAGDVQLLGVVEWVRNACDEVSPGLGIGFEQLSAEARLGVEAFCSLRVPLYHE